MVNNNYNHVSKNRHHSKMLSHLVWEQHNKKNIPEGFVIHHINGDVSNDRIENLQCISRSKHTKLHPKLNIKNPINIPKGKKLIVRKLPRSKSIFIVGIIMAFFLISMISAWDLSIDNYKEVSEDQKTIEIWDWNLLSENIKIGSIELLTNLNQKVGVGYVKVFEYELINTYEDVSEIIGSTDYYNIKDGMKPIQVDVDLKYKVIEERQREICTTDNKTQIENCKTITYEVTEYVDYNPKIILKDETIKISGWTTTKQGDRVEWIPEIYSKTISEWAEWTAGLNADLYYYYKMDEGAGATGTIIDSIGTLNATNDGGDNTTGKILSGYDLELGNTDFINASTWVYGTGGTFSVSGWYKFETIGISQFPASDRVSSANANFLLQIDANDAIVVSLEEGNTNTDTIASANGVIASTGVWYHIALTFRTSDNNMTIWLDGVNVGNKDFAFQPPMLDGDSNIGRLGADAASAYMDGVVDEFGFWRRVLTQTEIIQLYNGGDGISWTDNFGSDFPVVTLTAPVDEYNATTQIVQLKCLATDDFNLTNVTLFIDDVLKSTVHNPVNNTNNTFNWNFLADGTFEWNCQACDNESQCSNGTARIINVDTAPKINVISPPFNNSNHTTSTIFFNASTSLPVDTWIVNYNGTNITLSAINTSLEVPDGTHQLLLYGNNSVFETWGLNDSVWFNVDATIPTINLTYPTGDIEEFALGDNLTVNYSISDTNLDNCWFNYNSVNTTLNCSLSYANFTPVIGVQSLIVYANDTFGNINLNSTSWTYQFLENNATFNSSSFETSNENFVLNITTSINILSISAVLNYNGTNYLSTASCTTGDCLISNDIDIPLTITNPQLNTFYWNISIFNGTESVSIVTSDRTQNVSQIFLEACNATFTVQTLNFTTYDEQTLTIINPYKFNGAFNFWLGNGDIKKNNSFSNASTAEVKLCLSPNNTMSIDADISYDEAADTNYTERFYYFQDHSINNVSQDIFMYLLKSTQSTSFILKVQDENLLPLNNTIVEIWRYYPGIDEFRLVQTSKTNDAGKSVGFFEVETIDYKFIIKKDGEVLLETGQGKVLPETSPFTLTFNTGEDLGAPWTNQEPIPSLDSDLSFDDTTGIVTYTYIDTSTTFESARLLVQRESLTNNSAYVTICDLTKTLTSATITCDTTNETGIYIASSFITRSGSSLDKQISFGIGGLAGAGLLGLFFGWFLVLISASFFTVNEVAGIWSVTITIFLTNTMGLIKFGGVFVTAIFALAIIITWLLER